MGLFTSSLKTIVLLGVLTAVLLYVGSVFGGAQGLVIAFFFVIIMNGAAYWWSDKMALSMYKCEELPANHHITKMTRQLADMYGLPMPRVYIFPSRNPNAFATGRNPSKGAVAVSQGLLELLNDRELKGVIAHELSHIKHYDTLISTVAGMIAGVIGYLGTMAQWAAIFGIGNRGNSGPGMLHLLVIMIITPLMATIIQMAVSRTREYAADEGAARLLRDHTGLKSALMKLERSTKLNPMEYSETAAATEHLFIVNPFSGKSIMHLFSTHPSTADRVKRLEQIDYY